MSIGALALFSCCLLLAGARADENRLNGLIDEVIYEAVTPLIQQHKDVIAIPTMRKTFEYGEVAILSGSFGNISSLARTSDAEEVDGPDGSMTFSLALGLKEAHLDISFSYKLGPFTGKREVIVDCTSNSIYLQVTLTYSGDNCSVVVDKADIEELSGFTVRVPKNSKWDIIAPVESRLLSWGLNKLAGPLKTKINQVIQPIVSKAMSKASEEICDAIPH